ncbi:MAG: hypothetical protein GY772_08450 [bacterium]|nr:hypothetical protein [bacterium]
MWDAVAYKHRVALAKLVDHCFSAREALMACALTTTTGYTADQVYNLDQAWAGDVRRSSWAAAAAQQAESRMLRLPLWISRPWSEETRSCLGGSKFAAFHGTKVGGAMGVLRDGFLKPKPWEAGGSGLHGIYCLMTEDIPATDTLMKVVTMPKAWDGIIVEAIVFGNTVTVAGGVEEEALMVREGQHTHNSGKNSRWCVSPRSIQTTTIWLSPNAISERTVFLVSWELASGGGLPPPSSVLLTPSGSGGLPPATGSGGLPPPLALGPPPAPCESGGMPPLAQPAAAALPPARAESGVGLPPLPVLRPCMQPSPPARGRVELVSFGVAHSDRAFDRFAGADITVDLSCLARERWNDPDASIVLGARPERGAAGSGLSAQVREALKLNDHFEGALRLIVELCADLTRGQDFVAVALACRWGRYRGVAMV